MGSGYASDMRALLEAELPRIDCPEHGKVNIGSVDALHAHVLGASMWVSSEVTTRLAPPMRRVVRHFVPACAGPGGSG